ncbi:MAG: hypothetical protein ACLR1V_06735 [Coprococcus sp.]
MQPPRKCVNVLAEGLDQKLLEEQDNTGMDPAEAFIALCPDLNHSQSLL